jgi:O-antigen/teichoic acid export membrane protein
VDKVVLNSAVSAVSAAELGHYAVAQTVVGTSSALGTALSSVAFPRLAGSGESGHSRARKEGQLLLLTGLVVSAFASAIAAISAWAIPLVYGPEFVESVPLAWWFVPVAVVQGTSLMAGTILRGRALPGRAAWAQLAGLATTGIGLVASVPLWGVEGAAISLALGGLVATALATGFWWVDSRGGTSAERSPKADIGSGETPRR